MDICRNFGSSLKISGLNISSLMISVAILTFSCVTKALAMPPENASERLPLSKSKVSIENLERKTSVTGDLDAEVSDNALRANSGAKSKYSASFMMTYAGASLEKPLDDQRPNVGRSAIGDPVSLAGSFGLRFRFNKNKSVYMATGFTRSRPFHGREGSREVEVNTPQMSYNKTHAVGNWQLGENYLLYVTTKEYKRAIGEVATVGYSVTAKRKFGYSRFDGGGALNFSAVGYDKNEARLEAKQMNYGVSVSPSLQYNYSSRLNIFSQLSWLNYSHYRSESDEPFKFRKKKVSQTLGLGMAVSRDFYLAPYVAFEPSEIRSDRSSVNLTATINL